MNTVTDLIDAVPQEAIENRDAIHYVANDLQDKDTVIELDKVTVYAKCVHTLQLYIVFFEPIVATVDGKVRVTDRLTNQHMDFNPAHVSEWGDHCINIIVEK